MNTRLYVGNLSYDTTEDKLRQLFTEAGPVQSVSLPTDRMTGRPRGFGFVEMETGADAAKAVSMLNGRTIDDREIKVNEAKPQESRSGSSGGNRSFGRSRGY